MAIVINGNGIDMGGNPVSNAGQIDSIVDLSNEAIANGTSFEDYKAMLNE